MGGKAAVVAEGTLLYDETDVAMHEAVEGIKVGPSKAEFEGEEDSGESDTDEMEDLGEGINCDEMYFAYNEHNMDEMRWSHELLVQILVARQTICKLKEREVIV